MVSVDVQSSTHGSGRLGGEWRPKPRELGGVKLPNEGADSGLLPEFQNAEMSMMGPSAIDSKGEKLCTDKREIAMFHLKGRKRVGIPWGLVAIQTRILKNWVAPSCLRDFQLLVERVDCMLAGMPPRLVPIGPIGNRTVRGLQRS